MNERCVITKEMTGMIAQRKKNERKKQKENEKSKGRNPEINKYSRKIHQRKVHMILFIRSEHDQKNDGKKQKDKRSENMDTHLHIGARIHGDKAENVL